ncbi:hypothetical protein [Runella sp.]|jgi:hypothetical protein|uniref:hypothetical protein n=1 Tax=Runella sp. TaxID=1960881 RepID=UPI00261890E4|nr:hypothetical protein [Runella sp.]
MKHSRFTSALLFIFVSVFIISCSKDEPEPSMGDQVAGNYTLTKLALSNGLTADLPLTDPASGSTRSGTVAVTKVADDKITAKITQTIKDKAGKITSGVTDSGEVTLKKATTGEIEAYIGTSKIGTYSNALLTLYVIDPTLGNVTLIGKKN